MEDINLSEKSTQYKANLYNYRLFHKFGKINFADVLLSFRYPSQDEPQKANRDN